MDELIPTRATLIQRLKNWNDQSSWQDFFDTYWKLIYNFARKGGLSETEAQDVVQETMVAVAKRIPGFKYDPTVGTFKAWLFNIVRWRMADELRGRPGFEPYHEGNANDEAGFRESPTRPAHELEPRSFTTEPVVDDWDALWNSEWEKNLLDAAIAKVKRHFDPLKYQVFDLCVNKEWPPERVAQAFSAFGISVEQVYLIKHRVTQMIKDEVKRLETDIT